MYHHPNIKKDSKEVAEACYSSQEDKAILGNEKKSVDSQPGIEDMEDDITVFFIHHIYEMV